MNASSIEIVSGATVSADGVRGMPYGSDASYLGTGGGGSGGSILMEARNVSGGGLVSAKGGPSRGGSGAGGGGRVSIRAAHVSSQLALTSSGGATSDSYACAGAAGTVYVANGTSLLLIFDNSNENSDSSTSTPFPGDLNGVQLTLVNISRKASVDLRQAKSNNDVRSYGFDLDASSKVTGDSVVIDTSNASVRGSITGSTTVWLHNAQSGAGTVTAHGGSTIGCSSCKLKMSLAGSDVILRGSISAGTGEIQGLRNLTHSGNLAVSGSLLSIEAGTASITGTVTRICSGSACSSLVSVNKTLEMGGSLSCTGGTCSLSLRSGGDMRSSGDVSCSGNSQIRANGTISVLGTLACTSSLHMLELAGSDIQVHNSGIITGSCSLSLRSGGDMRSSGDVSYSGSSQSRANGTILVLGTLACTSSLCKLEAEGSDIQVQNSGRISGGDVILVAESLRVLGTVSTSGQGYVEDAGDGKGIKPSYGGGSTDYYRVSGSGAGHGGNGAGACFRYSSSYGSIPSGTVRHYIIAGMHAHASLCNRRGLSD
jgi:hypothetical protein